jgi:hypothetical protein
MVQPATILKVVRPPRVLDVGGRGRQIEEEGKEDKAGKKRRMFKRGKIK